MVRNCRLKIGCWISGHRETAERIITMKLGYLEFVEVLSKQLLNALNLQEQQIFFKKKAIDNKDRLFVETFENLRVSSPFCCPHNSWQHTFGYTGSRICTVFHFTFLILKTDKIFLNSLVNFNNK